MGDWNDREARYLEAFLGPLTASRRYGPYFGHERRLSAAEFSALYGGDFFYNVVGLSQPAVYAAHRIAGGLSSVYRQLGVGSRQLVRLALADARQVPDAAAVWLVHGQDLGCVVPVEADAGPLRSWMGRVGRDAGGVAVEVRQSCKTGDARRQQSYVEANAESARSVGLLPVLFLCSAQASDAVVEGYRNAGWVVLLGLPDGDPAVSSFSFLRDVSGFDMPAFLDKHRERIEDQVGAVVRGMVDDARDGRDDLRQGVLL